MDPDSCLRWVRELAGEVLAGRDADGGAAVELAGLVLDLDVFLSKGGAPPTEWQAKGTSPAGRGGGR